MNNQPSAAAQAPVAVTPPVQGDVDDDYLLALLMRLREVPGAAMPEAVNFMLAESRALYRGLGTAVPPDLEPFAERARRRLLEARLLPTDKLLEEIERKQLDIRARKLQAERSQVAALLREGAIDQDEATRLLDNVRRGVEELARRFPSERESAGIR